MTHSKIWNGDCVLEYKITNHFWLSVWNRSIVIHFVWSRFLNRNNDDNIINIFFCLSLLTHLDSTLLIFCSSNTSNDFQWEICGKGETQFSFSGVISRFSSIFIVCIWNLKYGIFLMNANQWRMLVKSVSKIVELLITTETGRLN